MADTRRLPVNGIPDPLYEAIITIAAREGKTLSRVGLDALELLARDRGEWPPGRRGMLRDLARARDGTALDEPEDDPDA